MSPTISGRSRYEALFDHAAFIERHLENRYEVTSNHFLSNVVGLFYLAAVFRDLPRGELWNRQCRDWLAHEMEVQVLADGADYESSVPYHRLVSELFLGAARVASATGCAAAAARSSIALGGDGRFSRRRAPSRRTDATGWRCR